MAWLARRFLVACVGLLVAAGAPPQWSDYRLMVDAGSSGSRLYIFKKQGDAGQLLAVHTRESDLHFLVVEPGLSSFARHPERAGPSLAPMLEAAEKYVPADARPSTPLWIKATAGLRLLEPSVVSTLVKSVSAHLRNRSNCPFAFRSMDAVSGEEEGVFAFLAVNDLLGYRKPFAGVLDLGGASVQIAFDSPGAIKVKEFVMYMPSQTPGVSTRQSLYVDSSTEFGAQEFAKRVTLELVSAQPTASQIRNPCMFVGHTDRLVLPAGRQVEFLGTSDPSGCEQIVQKLLHKEVVCLLEPCSFLGKYVAQKPARFYGMSGFFYTVANLGLVGWDDAAAVTPARILRATRYTCRMTMGQVRAAHGNVAWDHLQHVCLMGHLVYSLLGAYGFGPQDANVTFTRKLKDSHVDWTRGAVLFEEANPRYWRGDKGSAPVGAPDVIHDAALLGCPLASF